MQRKRDRSQTYISRHGECIWTNKATPGLYPTLSFSNHRAEQQGHTLLTPDTTD